MVGNKGKGSKSKPKALKPEPAELEPEKSSLGDSAVVTSVVKKEKDDIVIGMEIPNAEEQEKMVEITSGFIVSDGLEEKDQNAHEDNDNETYVMTEINDDKIEDGCTHEGTKNDVNEVGDEGHPTTSLSVVDNEARINTDNQGDDEPSLKSDNTGVEMEVIAKDVSAENEGLDFALGLTENMTNNLENHKEPSELSTELVGTTDKKEENANASSEVEVVTDKAVRPKKKVVKKLVKKKLVRKNAVNKGIPQPSDANNVTGEACEVDANKDNTIEDKASDLHDASVGECKSDNNELMSNKEAEVKPSVKANKKRNRNRKKKAPQDPSSMETIKDAQKPQAENNTTVSEQDLTNEHEEMRNSGDRASLLKNSKKKKIANKGSQEVVPKDGKKPKEGKSSKKVDSMGMIFMCNSETKKDCYRYKVLGLPASKKDMVLEIYKGTRLFLFDVDLRMMYGIYKAAGPGGYNIEPSAFKSQYPSQVRFEVLTDCEPLAEEKFKKALKDNYYSKKKFNFKLNNEQVKNLCKLFQENKKAESTKAKAKPRKAAAAFSSVRRDDKKRKRVEDTRRAVAARPPPLEQERIRRRTLEETSHAPVIIVDRYNERPAYTRETHVPSVAPLPMYQPILEPRTAPSRTYPYDRVSVVDPYRRETVIDHRDLAPSRVSRLPIERSHYDSYVPYREAPQVYSGQTYISDTRREHYDYGTSDRQYAEYYRTADYRPPPPLYRRY